VGSNRSSARTRPATSWDGGSRQDLSLTAIVAMATIVVGALTGSAYAQQAPTQVPADIIHNWGWYLVFGIGLVVLGILAIGRAVAATVISMLFFGWLLLIAAGIEVAQTVMTGRETGMFQHLAAAVLFGVVGLLIVWRPLVSAEILTLLMGAFFLVTGLFQIVAPLITSLPDWGWHTINGIITLLLGFLVLAQWPISGLWVIGMFVGIELLFYGIAWIAVALHLRPM
jgi:uncharacterized membrane protein HdeD (DUF308 family)